MRAGRLPACPASQPANHPLALATANRPRPALLHAAMAVLMRLGSSPGGAQRPTSCSASMWRACNWSARRAPAPLPTRPWRARGLQVVCQGLCIHGLLVLGLRVCDREAQSQARQVECHAGGLCNRRADGCARCEAWLAAGPLAPGSRSPPPPSGACTFLGRRRSIRAAGAAFEREGGGAHAQPRRDGAPSMV